MTILLVALTYSGTVNAQNATATPEPKAGAASEPDAQSATDLSTDAASNGDSTVTDTQALLPLGYLAFTNKGVADGGLFSLHLDGLPPSPPNGHYVLWALSGLTIPHAIGAFTTGDGAIIISGTSDLNLPELINEVQITLEPQSTDAVTATLPTTMSERVVVRGALSPIVVEQLRLLLQLYNENQSDANADADIDAAPDGVLSQARLQVRIAVQHTGFLRNALSEADIPQARRHAEHIINILDGKNGFMYGDLDRNGLPENPGDGVGIRVYLATSKAALPAVADLFTAATHLDDSAADVATTVDMGQALITEMFDKALQIFASDTATEANTFAGELTALVDELDAVVDDAHHRTLQLVSYSFFGPPQTATLPVIVATPTVTPIDTATEVPTQTPTPRPTNSPTVARATPTRRPPDATATPEAAAKSTDSATLVSTRTPTQLPSATATPLPTPPPPTTPTAIPVSPLPAIKSSALTNPAAGTRWQDPMDGTVYIYISGGTFQMGSDAANAASPKEEPRHTVSVGGFWLQQTETTNAQYARCIAAGACTPPANDRWDDSTFADHPVSNVSWQQANTYAAWIGGRLPTEAEWERTCRGNDDQIYAWGNQEPTDSFANYNNAIGDTAPVGSYPDGQSAFGPLDLSGNLWEWTSSLEEPYPYNDDDGREADDLDTGNRTVRGGSFYYTSYQIRCAARTGFPSDTANEHIGFRLVLVVGEK